MRPTERPTETALRMRRAPRPAAAPSGYRGPPSSDRMVADRVGLRHSHDDDEGECAARGAGRDRRARARSRRGRHAARDRDRAGRSSARRRPIPGQARRRRSAARHGRHRRRRPRPARRRAPRACRRRGGLARGSDAADRGRPMVGPRRAHPQPLAPVRGRGLARRLWQLAAGAAQEGRGRRAGRDGDRGRADPRRGHTCPSRAR